MTGDGSVGDRIRAHRLRRGLGQRELAQLAGRSESWLSQVERGVREVDRLSVLVEIARVLKIDIEVLAGCRIGSAASDQLAEGGAAELRRALSGYPGFGSEPPAVREPAELGRLAATAHQRYQAAEYRAVARELAGLISAADALSSEPRGDPRAVSAAQCQVYVVAAKLGTKLGDGAAAWIAADRAAQAAFRADSAVLRGMAAYQVVTAFMRSGRIDDAEQIALTAAEAITDDGPAGVSVQGSLFLISSVIAGRRSDGAEATARLRRARYLAGALGHDGNHAWTAFGPTNVAIHEVSATTELGQAKLAVRLAENVDAASLPVGLRSRRAQLHIDAAWAHAQLRDDSAAVVNLLETERTAPEALRYNVVVREVLGELMKRERRCATPGLRAVAARAGVLR
ncbi:helix-turn-helix transcriptional regulator [Saccharopolyspora sp. NFXS83]|uniref:helix-turn-helix domain-containing protein n=1 Tax=Saccharopolyspora sp. NFXS83 TaxID=2993560 RepID=UPI00224B91A6|nr:helix-turn-helix transcriptional regulator [Saccharopolyspora sp. NFXS83]MCX2729860.1 helix-turn-helix transcriptional regulator [Saccharopolyspora sp. NFXS83]